MTPQPSEARALRIPAVPAPPAAPDLSRLSSAFAAARSFERPSACSFRIVARRGRFFTDYVPVCTAHAWVGAECGTVEAAKAQTCTMRVELQIAYHRALELGKQGFSLVED